jgi:hypothetical protein
VSTPKRLLQWRIDRPAAGFGDPVSPHIDHLTAGSYCLGRNCCPPHAQKLCHHLRRNLVGDQRRLGNATWSGGRQKLKNAATVVVERNRAQLTAPCDSLAVHDLAINAERHVEARAALAIGDPYSLAASIMSEYSPPCSDGDQRLVFGRPFLKLVGYFHKS